MGRAHELRTLHAAFDDAVAGHGRVVLLSGEPGIGKTRTAEALADYVSSHNGRVLWGRCYEGGGAPAFWPWVQVLRACVQHLDAETLRIALGADAVDIAQMVPAIRERLPELLSPAATGSPEARFALFDGIVRFLGRIAQHAPLAIIFEDLRGADASSLLLVEFVARMLRELRILVLATYHDTAALSVDAWAQTIAEITREPVTEQIELHGFSVAEVAELVELSTGVQPPADLVAQLHERTDGNPLFVGEFLRTLAAGGRLPPAGRWPGAVPSRIKAVIRQRLASVSATCLTLLRVGAVVGREFAIQVVAPVALRLMGIAAAADADQTYTLDALNEAQAAGIITPVSGSRRRHRFAHALIRETLYDELSVLQRAQLHRQVGEAMEQLPDPDEHVSELAYHFSAAGDVAGKEKAVAYARRAGERAMQLLAYEEAARLFQMGLSILESQFPDDAQPACALLLDLGDAYRKAGNTAANKDVVLRAADIARATGNAPAVVRAALTYGVPLVWGEGPDFDATLVGLLEDGLAAAGPVDSPDRAHLLSRLATAVRSTEPPTREEALSLEAVQIARRIAAPETLARALVVRHTARADLHHTEERLAIASELVRIARQIGNPELEFQGRWLHLHDVMELGDPAALNEVDLCLGLAGRVKDSLCNWQAALVRSARPSIDGRWDEVERLAEEARRVGESTIAGATHGLWMQLLTTDAVRRRGSELMEFLAYAADHSPTIPALRCVLAYVYAVNGRLVEARAEFERVAADDFAGLPRDVGWGFSMSMVATACAVLCDTQRAGILYEHLRPYRSRALLLPGAPTYLGPTAYYLGMLAAVRAEWSAATEHFDAALAAAARLGARPFVARTQCQYAKMLMQRAHPGDGERALGLVDEALATARRCRIQSLEDEAQRLKERIGDSPSTAERAADSAAAAMFRLEGEFWTLVYRGTTVRLKDAKGFRYLAHLLRHPDQEILALDLMWATSDARSDLHGSRTTEPETKDRGPILDATAKATYKRRLADLREELEEAERHNDRGRAERMRREIDAITHQQYRLRLSGNGSQRGGALSSNTTGDQNTAVGWAALDSNITGLLNTAVGYEALERNGTGGGNVAAGDSALFSDTADGSNTAVGESALTSTTGDYNIGLGQFAGSSLTTGGFNVDIGNTGVAGESSTIRIGDIQTATFIAGIRGTTTGNMDAVPVLIDSNGQLGTMSSSRRFKTDIRDMGDASSKLLRLRPVTFKYKPELDRSGTTQYGLIAEEVARVMPELVAHDKDGKIETVKYQLLDALLLNEVQKQARQNAAQESELAAQRRQLTAQQERIAQLTEQTREVAALKAQLDEMRATLASLQANGGAGLPTATRGDAADLTGWLPAGTRRE